MRLPVSAWYPTDRRAHREAGVTLVELIVVITISGIIATILGMIILRPIQGYQALVRRGELVDAAEMSLRKISRDIHQALPNSVRIRDSLGNTNSVTCSTAGVTCAIEMLNTLDGGRYRAGPGVNPGGGTYATSPYWLSFNGADTDGFNVVNLFQNIPLPFTWSGQRLAIYNQGVTGADAYADANLGSGPYVITNPSVTTFTITNPNGDEDNIAPGGSVPNFNFRFASPNQRVFIVDKPVSYVCSSGAGGNITRYDSYTISATQPTAAGAFTGGTNALLTTPVTTCTFSYIPGTDQRAGLVTLDIIVQDSASGEQVRLLYQVHVDNAP